ncbi:MAG TPA: sigma-70 family RNA polymerase sigma factor [Kofleriaceae bacterium]|nr:sigma-70 family RNA polymerase sigma factor [Kofleriaceae bacterium]
MRDHQPEPETKEAIPSAEVIATLVENHRAFLAFIERRVGNRDVAEEILQNAFVKNIEKLDTVRDTAVGWFYKVLRNAIIDYWRRKTVADKRLESYATDVEANDTRDDELHGVVCKCIGELATTLKPEYADALQQIEIEGMSVKDYAERIGISSSNAGVRVFRAREALRKQVVRSCGTCAAHGCLDCTCGSPGEHACVHEPLSRHHD